MSDMTVFEQAKLMAPPKVERYKYQLVIKVPYEAIDALQARQIARGYLDASSLPKEAVVKLQRVQDNKEPIGVPL